MSGFIFNKAKQRFWGIFCNQTMTGRVTETENCQRYFCHWIFRRDCDAVRWIWLRDSLITSRWVQLFDLLLARQCGKVIFVILRVSYTNACLPGGLETMSYIEFSPNEKVGTRSTPNLRANLMKPLRRLTTNLMQSFSPWQASRAPPTTRMVACPFGTLKNLVVMEIEFFCSAILKY